MSRRLEGLLSTMVYMFLTLSKSPPFAVKPAVEMPCNPVTYQVIKPNSVHLVLLFLYTIIKAPTPSKA